MLKTNLILVTGLFLVSLSAMADSRVGEKSVFNASGTAEGLAFTGTLTMEIVQYSAENKTFVVRTTQQADGAEATTEDEIMSEDQMASDANVTVVLDECVTKGGSLEDVTVPAGTFEACVLPINGPNGPAGSITLAKAPFGFIRLEQPTASGTLKLELKEFKKN